LLITHVVAEFAPVVVMAPKVAEPVRVIVTASPEPRGAASASLTICPGTPAARAAGAGVTAESVAVVVCAAVVTAYESAVSAAFAV
jgi:hypothetical protein